MIIFYGKIYMKEGGIMRTKTRGKMVRKLYSRKTKVELISKRRCMMVEKQAEPLTCMNDIKSLIQQSMKEKGINSKQARKSLGIKRYEK